MKFLEKLINFLSHLSCLVLMIMMLHVFFDVSFKFLFNSPIVATLSIVSYYYMVFVVFLPLGKTEIVHEHVYADVITRLFPEKIQFLFYIFASLVSLIYFLCLGYQTFLDAVRAYQVSETYMANFVFYVWPSRWFLPIGFFTMAIAIIYNIKKAFLTKSVLYQKSNMDDLI